jgi:4-diphosphocytidyl-2-C-methyl-D-erythritol kinase
MVGLEKNGSSDLGKASCLNRLSFYSPSKINLFFKVLKKRSDGYHEIASLYQIISLCDIISLEQAEEDELLCSDPSLACDASNLVLKALALFRKKTGILNHFKIYLEKRIPMQAGLGGGSGNAATTLWGMNRLLGCPASEEELCQWSSELGSDVPVFFSQGAAYCTGRGEILEPCEPKGLPDFFWIAKPKMGLSTPLVYQHCNVSSLPERDPLLSLQSFYNETKDYYNDLEFPAFQLLPNLRGLKEDLFKLGFSKVVMTGSGTAFFCIGDVKTPVLQSIDFYKVQPLSRKDQGWYELGQI